MAQHMLETAMAGPSTSKSSAHNPDGPLQGSSVDDSPSLEITDSIYNHFTRSELELSIAEVEKRIDDLEEEVLQEAKRAWEKKNAELVAGIKEVKKKLKMMGVRVRTATPKKESKDGTVAEHGDVVTVVKKQARRGRKKGWVRKKTKPAAMQTSGQYPYAGHNGPMTLAEWWLEEAA